MERINLSQEEGNNKLNVFVGRWKTDGDIYDDDNQISGKVDATDTYEWMTGNYVMLHTIESNMGEIDVRGVELLGYDVTNQNYFIPFFDNQGMAGHETLQHENGTWIWQGEDVMGVNFHRCTARFENADLIKALHEKSDDGVVWKKWMDIQLKRI